MVVSAVIDLHCNPSPEGDTPFVNITNFECTYSDPGQPPWRPKKPETGCPPPCERVNISVGKDPAQHVWPGTPQSHHAGVLAYFGGWVSCPSIKLDYFRWPPEEHILNGRHDIGTGTTRLQFQSALEHASPETVSHPRVRGR